MISRQRSEGLVNVNWQSEQDLDDKASAALGYAVHVVHHLSEYLGIPLKFPVHAANSKSGVWGRQLPILLTAPG